MRDRRLCTDGHGRGPQHGTSPRTGAEARTSPRTGPRKTVYGLTFGAELSVHVPASARCPAGFPGRGGRGRAGAVMARVAVRESVTLAGRAERARAAAVRHLRCWGWATRAGMGASCWSARSSVFGPAHRLGCSRGNGHGRGHRRGCIVRVEVTDRAGPGTPGLRPAASDAEGRRGLRLVGASRRGGATGGAAGSQRRGSRCRLYRNRCNIPRCPVRA